MISCTSALVTVGRLHRVSWLRPERRGGGCCDTEVQQHSGVGADTESVSLPRDFRTSLESIYPPSCLAAPCPVTDTAAQNSPLSATLTQACLQRPPPSSCPDLARVRLLSDLGGQSARGWGGGKMAFAIIFLKKKSPKTETERYGLD